MTDANDPARATYPAAASAASTELEPRCRCGYGRWHFNVGTDAHYSVVGWFLLMMGATPEPTSIDFRCKKCGDSLGSSREMKDFRRATR